MESWLGIDNKSKHLTLNFKKRFEHSSDVQLKVRGALDTQSARGSFNAGIHKFFRLGSIAPSKPGDVFQSDTRLRLGLGAKGTSESDEVHFSVSAKKKFVLNKQEEVVRNRVSLRSYTQLRVSANYDYNVRSEQWAGEAEAVARHAMFGFSDGQDLRVTAGYRAAFTQRGVTSAEPFVRVQENCWGVQATYKPNRPAANRWDWTITYDL